MKVFNYSELHFSELTSFKIHTLVNKIGDKTEFTITRVHCIPHLSKVQGDPKGSERFFKNGCGIQMSQATPTKFSMLFKHNFDKLSWKFGDHSLNFSFVHGLFWLRILESIHRYGIIVTFCKKKSKGHCEAILDVKKIYFIDF